MNFIDERITEELENIKEQRAIDRKENRKPKYNNFAVKCLYDKKFAKDKKSKNTFIVKIIRNDEIYGRIYLLLYHCEYILNKSYLIKYLAQKYNYSSSTVYKKIDELIELNVLENIDSSVRITRLALRHLNNVNQKTINYKKDTKSKSKLKINMYDKKYTEEDHKKLINGLKESDLKKIKDFKIKMLNREEVVVCYKKKLTEIQKNNLDNLIVSIDTTRGLKLIELKQQKMQRELTKDEQEKCFDQIKRVFVITKLNKDIKIRVNNIETEVLEDVIDYTEYKK